MILYLRPINAFSVNYFENGRLTKTASKITLKTVLALKMVAFLKMMLTVNNRLLDIEILHDKMLAHHQHTLKQGQHL